MVVKLWKSDQCGPRNVQKTDFLPKIGKIGLGYILIIIKPIKKPKNPFIHTLTWSGPITYQIFSHFEVYVKWEIKVKSFKMIKIDPKSDFFEKCQKIFFSEMFLGFTICFLCIFMSKNERARIFKNFKVTLRGQNLRTSYVLTYNCQWPATWYNWPPNIYKVICQIWKKSEGVTSIFGWRGLEWPFFPNCPFNWLL